MSDRGRSHPASSNQHYIVKDNSAPTHGLSQSAVGSTVDVSLARQIYYPCFGNVDIKSYVDARTYGLGFRRLHDEWIALGSPLIDTRHWPRMAGHRGLPTGPEDFVNVAEYYEGKIFEQAILHAQGKQANRDRPMDEFIIAMVTTAAVGLADFVVYRLVRDQPSTPDSTIQHTWYRSFRAFLKDSITNFVAERKVCDRLGPHNCVVPLLYGQAQPMSLPDLLQNFDYQVQIFQNLFPNFGDHIDRCAAARPQQQQWSPSSVATTSQTRGMGTPSNQSADSNNKVRAFASHSSANEQGSSRIRRGSLFDDTIPDGAGQQRQQQQDSKKRWNVTSIPPELEGRSDLFIAGIDPAIRCDVPLEKVVSVIDSHRTISASTSVSSGSTPASIAATTPYSAAPMSSGVTSGASGPSSDTDWKMRTRRESRDVPNENATQDLPPENLTLRVPVQSQSQSWWPESISGRATSEDGSMVTPEEAMATHAGRAHSSSTASYFSSLPVTPTTMYSSGSLLSPQDASQLYHDQMASGSRAGLLPLTSTSDPDSRKRTRAEQNRDKMKAYHRRVMQQREALTSILTDMAVHVGSAPMPSQRSDERSPSSLVGAENPTLAGMFEDVSGGAATTSSIGRSSAQEPGWPVSLRNKQKQESKARLRRREIDQVHELGQYASFARTTLMRLSKSDPLTPTTGAPSSAAIKVEDEQSSSASAWGQLQAQQVSNMDAHRSQAILRVFQHHRPNWIALISAEQRLAGEVAKLWPSTDEGRTPGGNPSGYDREGAEKEIKALLDRIQMDERAGLLPIPAADSTSLLSGSASYDTHASLARGSGGVMGAGVFMTTASAAGRTRSATLQPYQGQGGYSTQAAFMQGAPLVISPSSSDYGATISPSGVTRPAGADEGGDYFTQERRRYQGQYSDGSGTSMAGLTAYSSAEQANAQYTSRMPSAGVYRSSALAPSVLAPSVVSGYAYGPTYAGAGAQQHTTGVQGPSRSSAMSTSPAQPISALEDAQLRMSTSYSAGNYGSSMMQAAAAPSSRMEQGTGLYHSQLVQAPSIMYPTASGQQSGPRYEGQQPQQSLQAVGSAAAMQQYRSSQPASPQYPPSQQSPYGEQPPYGGAQ